jgi:hypothetical protein
MGAMLLKYLLKLINYDETHVSGTNPIIFLTLPVTFNVFDIKYQPDICYYKKYIFFITFWEVNN